MMMRYLQRILFSCCLLVWGGALLYFYHGPHLIKYLDPKFHTTVLIGGLGCCVVGLFNLLTVKVEASCGHGGEGHDHESSDMNPFMALLLILVPLCASLKWTEHKVHEALLEKQSSQDADASKFQFLADLPPFTRETLEETRTKSEDGYFHLNLTELFYSAGDPELVKVFSGLKFETEAILRDEPNRNPDGKRMRLYRMFMTCCAADMKAIPLSIEIDGEHPEIETGSWVKVGGDMSYETSEGVVYPVLKVKRIEKIPAPPEQFQY